MRSAQKKQSASKRRVLAASLIVSLIALHACANGVTALMLMPMWHLVFLNLFIGIAEGFALWHAGVRPRRAVPIMIMANYTSAWTASFFLYPIYLFLRQSIFKDDPFFNPYAIIGAMIAISLVGSVICEVPFVLLASKGSASPRRRVLRAYGLAQLATHATVSLLYIWASNLSLLGGMRHEQSPAPLTSNLQGWVYYISPQGDELRRVRLDGTLVETVLEGLAFDPHSWSRLYWLPAEDGAWNLHADDESPIVTKVRGRPGLFRHDDDGPPDSPDLYAADMQEPDARPWNVFVMNFSERGLRLGPSDVHGLDRSRRPIGFGIPFEVWASTTATILPGNVIVAGFRDVSELGDDRIILIDPDGNRIALLARGAGPVVMLDE